MEAIVGATNWGGELMGMGHELGRVARASGGPSR
jgi:hypothetical protein